MDGFATLIGYKQVQDELGQWIPTEVVTMEVPVTEQSLTRAEYFEAGRNGLNASTVLVTASINYDGQTEVEYNGRRFRIYRTYYNDSMDEIELYLEQKGGAYEG